MEPQTGLVQLWSNAGKTDMETKGRLRLFAETENFITNATFFLQNRREGSGLIKTIKNVVDVAVQSMNPSWHSYWEGAETVRQANEMVQELGTLSHSELNSVARWAARYTIRTTQRGMGPKTSCFLFRRKEIVIQVYQGAQAYLLQLIAQLLALKREVFGVTPEQEPFLEKILYLQEILKTVKCVEEPPSFAVVPKELLPSILSFKCILAVRGTSQENRRMMDRVISTLFEKNLVSVRKLELLLHWMKQGFLEQVTTLDFKRWDKVPTDADVQILAEHSQLKSLTVNGFGCISSRRPELTDDAAPALSKMIFLEELGLAFCQLKNFSFFSFLKSLVRLDISHTPVHDASPLARCSSLQFLDISHCTLESFVFLSSLKELRVLNLSYTNIADLQVLNPCQSLLEIHLKSCSSLTDLTPLLSLPALQHVHLHKEQIESMQQQDPVTFETLKNECEKKGILIHVFDPKAQESCIIS